MIKNYAILLLTVCSITAAKAQQKVNLQSLIPAAPNAAELGKYGAYPVGTSTGTPQINFPLYQIESGSLKLPISLSYHASGIQVNQKSTDVGLGWSVVAGGTIVRTIYGSADDKSPFGYFNYSPPTFNDLFNIHDYTQMAGMANGGYDLEPDLFVYNLGDRSGKFIYDLTGVFRTIPFDPVVITKSASGDGLNFRIVDDRGVIYQFNQRSGTASEELPSNTTSSWHLTEMISADLTDTISFTYEIVSLQDPTIKQVFPIGRSQTSTSGGPVDVVGDPLSPGGIKTISGTNTYTEALVKEIRFKNGRITFTRLQLRKDTSPQTNMLNEILVYNTLNEVVKKIEFHHDYFLSTSPVEHWSKYRLKLTGFSTSGPGSDEPVKHSFGYEDTNEETTFPVYGSYNIDYWGYFNGANNLSLIPNMIVYATEINGVQFANGESYSNDYFLSTQSWNIGSANREPSATHMKAGVLNKVKYPTGGHTTFDYEPHRYKSSELKTQNRTYGETTAGIDKNTKSEETSPSFSYPSEPELISVNAPSVMANLTIKFSASNIGNTEWGDTQVSILRDVTAGTIVKTWKHEGDLTQPLQVNETVMLHSGHSYEFKNEIYGLPAVTIENIITWTENTDEPIVKIGGGLRIRSIKNYDSENGLPIQETYIYGENEDGFGTKMFDEKNFYRNYEDVVTAYFVTTGGGCSLMGHLWQRNFLGISKYNAVNYQGSPILYSKVTKYQGDESVNTGKTIYRYSILADPMDFPDEFVNSGNYGSINTAWNAIQLKEETIYKKALETYIPVLSRQYDYTDYNQVSSSGIILKQHKHSATLGAGGGCLNDPSNPRYGQGFFTMYQYPIKTGISKRTQELVTRYDEIDPTKRNITETNYEYGNAANRYVTETRTTESNGVVQLTRLKYPQDFPSAVSSAMITKNILSEVVEEKKFKLVSGAESLLSTKQISYKVDGNLIVPENVTESFGGLAPQIRVTYNKYDLDANLLEQQKANDFKYAYIWGYGSSLPIAQALNAASSDIAYTSFEYQSDGTWTINSGQRVSTSYVTGSYAYSLSDGAIVRTGLDSEKNYVVTLKALPGASILVNGLAIPQGTISNGWTYYEAFVGSSSSITVSGNGTIDELRLFPKGAQMTTYTFEPLVGVTSATDPNNVTIYYEYDDLGRLKVIRNNEKNITKEFQYNYVE